MSGSTDPEILNIEQAAQLLGVSVKTFNKVLHSQNLPARKIGREWKFSRQALILWVGEGKSADYYRESTSTAVVTPTAPPEGKGASQSEADKSEHRRTSGWKIETE